MVSGLELGRCRRTVSIWPDHGPLLARRAPSDGEVRGYAERYRAEPLGLPGEPDVGEPFEQHTHGDVTVQACQWRAETEVRTRAEGQVRVAAAADIKRVRIGKGRTIAVGARREDDALLSRGHTEPADVGIGVGSAQYDTDG